MAENTLVDWLLSTAIIYTVIGLNFSHEFPDLPKFAMPKFGVTLNEQHCSITHRTIRSHRTTMMLFLITECSHFSSSIAICTTDFSTRSTCCRHSFPIQCTHVYKCYIHMYNCRDNFLFTYRHTYLDILIYI